MLALQREDLGSMCFPIIEQGRSGQDKAVYSANLQCARAVCSPRAVGPAELSAGHAVVQGQRPQTGPQKWILCENGQLVVGYIKRLENLN